MGNHSQLLEFAHLYAYEEVGSFEKPILLDYVHPHLYSSGNVAPYTL